MNYSVLKETSFAIILQIKLSCLEHVLLLIKQIHFKLFSPQGDQFNNHIANRIIFWHMCRFQSNKYT